MDEGPPESKLEIAASAGDLSTLKVLFGDGDFDAKSETAVAALQNAAVAGHWDAVRLFVEVAGMDVSSVEAGGVILQYASVAGRLDIMRMVVDRGTSVKTRAGANALLSAASIGRLDIVEYLSEMGADVVSHGGDSALGAAKAGFWDVVAFIIRAGAELAAHGWGVQLLALADTQGQDQVVLLLRDKGVEVKSEAGQAALLEMASTQDYPQCRVAARYLVEHGVDLQSEAEAVSIRTAAMYGDLDMVQCILAAGLQAASEAGGKALESAGLLGTAEEQRLVSECLREHGAIQPPPPEIVFDADF